MQKSKFSFVFLSFIFLSFLFFFLGKTGEFSGAFGFFGKVFSPLSSMTYQLTALRQSGSDSKLEQENKGLVKKLVDDKKLRDENSALSDQFQTAYPRSQNLLPAKVVSAPSFVPGVTSPDYLVIDKGESDKIQIGSAVVFKDNLVGKVVEMSSSFSKVMLVSNSSLSISAMTMSVKGSMQQGAFGVIRGLSGQDMILDNVLLSENIQIGDYVVTKGDMDVSGVGYPPSLIVGKISSVDKKSSDLFQKAKIKSLVNFSGLNMVFVVLGQD